MIFLNYVSNKRFNYWQFKIALKLFNTRPKKYSYSKEENCNIILISKHQQAFPFACKNKQSITTLTKTKKKYLARRFKKKNLDRKGNWKI